MVVVGDSGCGGEEADNNYNDDGGGEADYDDGDGDGDANKEDNRSDSVGIQHMLYARYELVHAYMQVSSHKRVWIIA